MAISIVEARYGAMKFTEAFFEICAPRVS